MIIDKKNHSFFFYLYSFIYDNGEKGVKGRNGLPCIIT